MVTRAEILRAAGEHYGAIAAVAEETSAPADRFRLADGTVFGIISSTTEPFCRSCDRSRLTADGMWFLCLYAARGTRSAGPLRAGASNEEIAALLGDTWRSATRSRRRSAAGDARPHADDPAQLTEAGSAPRDAYTRRLTPPPGAARSALERNRALEPLAERADSRELRAESSRRCGAHRLCAVLLDRRAAGDRQSPSGRSSRSRGAPSCRPACRPSSSATDGDDGGYGAKYSRARAVASMSPPANTVARWSGRSVRSARAIPGRALPAAQPQTELTTIIVVPGRLTARRPPRGVCSSSNPMRRQLLAHRREEVFRITLGDHLVDHSS